MVTMLTVGKQQEMGFQSVFFLFLFVTMCSGDFPHINSNEYLQLLADHVERGCFSQVMIIVGPKDAGKSAGLSLLQAKWEKMDYLVVEIDLKGKSRIINGQEVMSMVSKDLTKKLGVFNYSAYWHLYRETIKTCLDPNVTMWNWFAGSIMDIVAMVFGAMGSIVLSIYMSNFLQVTRRIYCEYRWLFWFLMTLVSILGLLFITTFFILWNNQDLIYMVLRPYDISLKNGDWSSLICFLNVIATVQPDHKPILIIKEVINMDHESLQECMQSLEQVKQGKIKYPIILETSDNMWFNITALKKSRSAFEPYYVPEMSYDEGYDDLVTSLHIWTPEEYNTIYQHLGGHTGSYKKLWNSMTTYRRTLQGAIEYMISATHTHLLECVLQSPLLTPDVNASMILQFLSELRGEKYVYTVKPKDITSVMKYLFDCNILFFNGTCAYPQKKLMEISIEHYLNISSKH